MSEQTAVWTKDVHTVSRLEAFSDAVFAPRWSLQNRPMVVTAKAANGDGPGQCCFTPLNRYRASPFWYASSGDST